MTDNIIQAKAASKAVATKAPKTIQDYIKVMEPGIKMALPSVMTPERFTRIALSAVSNNPRLGECSPGSFIGAMMAAAQLGLEPNTVLGQSYLIPYRNHGVMECQFQIGYKGLIDLAYRSGDVSIIQAHTVYSHDQFDYELGLEPKLSHKPAMGDRGDPIAYYAMFRTKEGGYGFQVMSIEDVKKHRDKFSRSATSGPWVNNFDEMAKKTVLKKVLKYAPLKSDFLRAVAQDETIKSDLAADMSEVPDTTVIDVDQETGEVLNNAE